MDDLSLPRAERAIGASLRHARAIGVSVTAAVVDAGGNLVALKRMDEAILGSLDIAINKAYTANALRLSTSDLDPLVQPGQALHGLATAHRVPRPLVTFGGGVPIRANGAVIGAIGVSGGTPQEDAAIAEAGGAATGGET